MKTTIKKYGQRLSAVAMALTLALAVMIPARAVNPEHYATNSALSTGKWVKIKVSSSGMQYVSNSQLSTMGFSDPSKVNVYGFGGRQISEVLNESHPDDLPQLPVIRTSGGIIFFGVDHIDWSPLPRSSSALCYEHTMQSYSENSYYMLSDIDRDAVTATDTDMRDIAGLETVETFFERLVHEKEIYAPSNTGRVLFGEDFRNGSQQTFDFQLPGNVGGEAAVNVQFGSKTTGNGARLNFSSNGRVSASSVSIPVVTSEDQFMRITNQDLNVSGIGENLKLTLSYSTSGVLKFARLDFIEVGYERALKMNTDQLYFYLNEEIDVAAVLTGITSETEIWDVTVRHAPEKVSFNRTGNTATFRVPQGYREYVAFNPSKVSLSPVFVGSVGNQDIHGLETPDMVIITPTEFKSAAERVANLHRETDGMTVHVLTPDDIYNEFSSGTPDLSAFRKMLKMWYDRSMAETGGEDYKTKYCLIFSRPTYDNKGVTDEVKSQGYPHVPIWQSISGTTENTSYSTDDFIGMLADNPSVFTMGIEQIHVAVGRFPVRTLEEANIAADKLEEYVRNPEKNSWRNNVLIIADDQDNGQHLEQAEELYQNMIKTKKGNSFQFERLYLDNFVMEQTSVGLQYPEAKNRLLSKIEEGQSMMVYVGHANTVSWTHEKLLTWKEITSFTNERWPVLYAATCEFARWDALDYSGAEVMWAYPKAGIIATICPSRSVFISQNGPLTAQVGKYAYALEHGTRLGDVYRNSKNGLNVFDDNKLRYALIGDPAMQMPIPTHNVSARLINETEINLPDVELPVIPARSTPVVSGEITDADGNKVSDFNGLLYIKLYDSEKVVTTRGNGSSGKVIEYNDRKTKLYEGVTKVTEGQWEVKINMPSEIEENYTPGRMTFYAVADDGREANGSTEKFYIYGYDSDAEEDLYGPRITQFTINSDDFTNGGLSHTTPVVFAAFTDESGINVSEAGIGHQLSLTLDGTTVYDDVTNFYIPDPEDPNGGSVIYQLPEITPGKHELKLSVWDNANNSTYSVLTFNVAVNKKPEIHNISTVYASDNSGVDFIVSSDRPLSMINCKVEVFDISGIKVWSTVGDNKTSTNSTLTVNWNYTTASGQRLEKGIYVCRVTVESPEGGVTSKSKKIVVPKL